MKPAAVEKHSAWNNRAFPRREHIDRLEKAREIMTAEGLAACICTSPELLYYFTGYEAHTHHAIGAQALILWQGEREPLLIIRDGDLPQAEETVVIGDVRSFRLGAIDLSQLIAEAVAQSGNSGKKLGVDFSGATMNGALTMRLMTALGDSTTVDCWRLLGKLRTVLSDREIAYVREAAAYANAGVEAFYQARLGMTEIELAAEIEYAMRSRGSDYPAISTWMASGERSHCQHGTPTNRRLARGDLVHAEFSGVARRYQCVAMGSLVIGEPNPLMQKMAEGGKAAFYAGLNAVQNGGTFGALEDAYLSSLRDHGLSHCFLMRFGVGISAAYPPVWENQITIQYESKDAIQPGMIFYIHASLQSLEDKMGMLLGGSFLMTEAGPERLDKGIIELVSTNRI